MLPDLSQPNPFPDYARYRQETPILYAPEAGWFVFSYEHVDRLFHEPRLSNDRMEGFLSLALPGFRQAVNDLFEGAFKHWVLSLDDPEHRALRKKLTPHFSERAVARLVPIIERTVAELLAELPEHGSLDFAQSFAYRLPVLVISGLLGVPEAQQERVLLWSDHVAAYFNVLPPNEETSTNFVASSREMLEYLQGLQTPGLLADLRQEGLPEEIVLANATVLLVAGHETTRNLLGSLTSLLLRHPEQLELLRQNPAMWPAAVEEGLRYEPPNPMMMRMVGEDFTYEGHEFKRGQMVFLAIGSANRDPAFVADPERFDVTRKPGKHLGFGSGPHFCLGAILARKEVQLAMPAVLARLPDLRLDPARPEEWTYQAGMRGPRSLPVLY